MMTKVKICGLMEKEHVIAAVEAGADAVGFVFAPSKRRISVEQATRLASHVPNHVKKIGVFVDPTIDELLDTFQTVPLDFAQFHGNETPEFIAQTGVPSIKAFSIKEQKDIQKLSGYDVDYFLVDAPGEKYAGGSGKSFNWQHIQGFTQKEKLILAGGLHTGNVREAIQQVRPYMVDVSSGVETNGRKDEKLIRAFIRTVKEDS